MHMWFLITTLDCVIVRCCLSHLDLVIALGMFVLEKMAMRIRNRLHIAIPLQRDNDSQICKCICGFPVHTNRIVVNVNWKKNTK